MKTLRTKSFGMSLQVSENTGQTKSQQNRQKTKDKRKVANLEQDKVAQALEIVKLKQRFGKLEKKRRSKSFGLKRLRKGKIVGLDADEDVTLVDMDTAVEMDAESKGRMEEDVTAAKEVNAAEPTVFDDEEEKTGERRFRKAKVLQQEYDQKKENIDWNIVAEQMQEKHFDNIKKYQSLKRKPISIAQARKNMIVYLKNMAGYKIQHFKGMTYDQVRPIFEREYNHVQTFLKLDRDEEPTKKRAAKETLLQESFKKLRAEVEVSEGSRTYWRIIRVGGITQAYQSFEDMLKDFDRKDLDALWRITKEKERLSFVRWSHDLDAEFKITEKDYPLSDGVMTLMLSSKLQVKEDSEVARDLVMKIFLKANQPKCKSLDTSSN
nr:hypothetical protein [Tanacetum cinerariifolium]